MQVIKGSSGLTAEVQIVNPQVAKRMLEKCYRPRNVAMTRVYRYAHEMDGGNWVVAEPLMFNCDGRLIEGQHRLKAVIVCGKPVRFLVVRGYDRDKTFGKLGGGAERKLRHWFQINNETLPDVLARVVYMAARDEAGRIPTQSGGGFRFTPTDGLDFLIDHPTIRDSVVKGKGTVNTLAPRAMLSFCHYKFSQFDAIAAEAFLLDLVTGESTGDGDPVFMLRQKLRANRRAAAKLSQNHMLALIYKAWNAERGNIKLKNLEWNNLSDKPEPFPTLR